MSRLNYSTLYFYVNWIKFFNVMREINIHCETDNGLHHYFKFIIIYFNVEACIAHARRRWNSEIVDRNNLTPQSSVHP